MRPSLTFDDFADLASRFDVVPLTVTVLADFHTPVSLFDRLVGDADGFLLESVEGGERWGRWSFVGWNPAFVVTSHDGEVTCTSDSVTLAGDDPLTVLEGLVTQHDVAPLRTGDAGDEPPLHTGLVGYLGYDAVRYIEHLPNRPVDDRGLPEMVWQAVGSLAALDRLTNTVTLVHNVYCSGDPAADYDAAIRALEDAVDLLSRAAHGRVDDVPAPARPEVADQSLSRADFMNVVERCIGEIRDGEVFQIVPSVRFATPYAGEAFSVYRALRLVNPSPYMFFVRTGGVTVAGSSPELMSRVRDGVVYSRPIAGTRPRGTTLDEDAALEVELLADPKERAEHVMLIDLARNDLGRVCAFGSVTVDDLMVIERYSHVMHIVSGVSGRLRDGISAIEVLRATFPHGTVSGAPKVRAMELLDEMEPVARGPYAGAVGYVDYSGNLDTAIALRTAVFSNGTAWVQAGAGIVVDSDPAAEYDECVNKAAAVLGAIEAARSLGGPQGR